MIRRQAVVAAERRASVRGFLAGSDRDRHVFASKRLFGELAHFCLAFQADQSDESSCANRARKGYEEINMTNAEANTPATVAEQGADVAPEKVPSKKGASQKKGAPKGHKAARGRKAKAAPKTEAKTSKRVPKPAGDKQAIKPRAESKGAIILALIGRAKGATLTEIRKATDWQAHSVRGFLSTAAKKHRLDIQSSKNDDGERVYKIAK